MGLLQKFGMLQRSHSFFILFLMIRWSPLRNLAPMGHGYSLAQWMEPQKSGISKENFFIPFVMTLLIIFLLHNLVLMENSFLLIQAILHSVGMLKPINS